VVILTVIITVIPVVIRVIIIGIRISISITKIKNNCYCLISFLRLMWNWHVCGKIKLPLPF
jgi:hypothetical protein